MKQKTTFAYNSDVVRLMGTVQDIIDKGAEIVQVVDAGKGNRSLDDNSDFLIIYKEQIASLFYYFNDLKLMK